MTQGNDSSDRFRPGRSDFIQPEIQVPPIELQNIRVKSEHSQDDEPKVEYRIICGDLMTPKTGCSHQKQRKRKKDNSNVLVKQTVNKMAKASDAEPQMNHDVITIDDEHDTAKPLTSIQKQKKQNPATNFETLLEGYAANAAKIKKYNDKLKLLHTQKANIVAKLKNGCR